MYAKTSHLLDPRGSWTENDLAGRWVLQPFNPEDIVWVGRMMEGGPVRLLEDGAPARFTQLRPSGPDGAGVSPEQVAVLSPAFHAYVAHNWTQGIKPTSGMIGIVMALHLCDEVDVYGFNTANKTAPYFYFNATYETDKNFGAVLASLASLCLQYGFF